jgi:anti-sigma regulatory factor (Ser/Thr protein kinase)
MKNGPRILFTIFFLYPMVLLGNECLLPLAEVGNPELAKFADFELKPGVEQLLPSNMAILDPVRDKILERVGADAKAAGLEDEARNKMLFGVKMTINEVVSNAIKHGNGHDPRKSVHLKYTNEKGKIQLEVSDESGNFFDPDNPNDPRNGMRAKDPEDLIDTDGLAKRRAESHHDPDRPNGEGGRGVFLSQGFTDGLIYQPQKDGDRVVGTHVTATWNLTSPP